MKRSLLPVCAGLLTGIAVAALAFLAAGSAFHQPGRGGAVAALLAGLFAAWACWRATRTPKEPDPPPLTLWQTVMLCVFGLAALRSFFWLIYESGELLMVGSRFNLGDIALHLHLINHFASGVPLWPANSIFPDGLLRYPAGMNVFNAALTVAGVPVLTGLVWAGLTGSALAAFALRRWGGAFALAALLFNGGLAGFSAFATADFHLALHGVEWKNLFLTVFVTQRGFLWALPAGLLLLCVWRARLDGARPVLPQWVEVLLYATLPMFHLHTFLFLSVLLACAWLFAPDRRTGDEFLRIGGVALIPASLLAWLASGGFSLSGAVAFAPGWMQRDQGWLFWWENFGISLPLLGVLGGLVVWRGGRTERIFVGVGLGFWVACALFRFAPWPWDNIKLLIWAWLVCAPFLWERILSPLHVVARAGLLLLLFFSGALALVEGLSPRHRYQLLTRAELAQVESMLAGIPPTARFAAAPDYAHPLLLTGRRIMMGFSGHLWSHGYEYHGIETALRRLYQNPAAADLDPLLAPVTHVFVGPRERSVLGAGPWQQAPPGWREISRRGDLVLFGRDAHPLQ